MVFLLVDAHGPTHPIRNPILVGQSQAR